MDISTVVRVHNNQNTIKETYRRVSNTLSKIGRSYEILFINDGSTDESWELIRDIQKKDPHVTAINFTRHHGESAGLQAGFETSVGEYIFTISPSLENSPRELAKLFKKLVDEGHDMVVGNRVGRHDGRPVTKLLSRFAHRIITFIIPHRYNDVTSPIRVMRRDISKNLKLYGDSHLLLPVLASLYGAKFAEVEVKHYKPKYKELPGFKTSPIKVLFDLLLLKFFIDSTTPPFNATPIRFLGVIGTLSTFFGLFLALYLSVLKIFYGQDIGDRPMLLLAFLLMIVGVLSVLMGLLGEIIIRTYFESAKKSIYTIKDKLHS